MEFEEACSEMNFILDHMNPNDLKKIPKEVRDFFRDNKSILYKVNLDETRNLYEQELKDETKAFIKIIYAKYFGREEEKQEINDIINKEETKESNNQTTEIVIYKENKILKIIKKIINAFKNIKFS